MLWAAKGGIMRPHIWIFVVATLVGAALGSLWNLPVFGNAYKSFIALFMDPAAPLGAATTMVLLAFIMGVPRIHAGAPADRQRREPGARRRLHAVHVDAARDVGAVLLKAARR
jgi:hypothetical protein